MQNEKNLIRSFIIIVLFASLTNACTSPIQERTENVSGFNGIEIKTFGEFVIKQSDTESLTIEAPRDFLRYIITDVQDEILVIRTRRGFFGSPVRRSIFTITVKDMENISLSGAGAIKVFSLESNSLRVNLTGAGSIEIDDLNAERLDVNLTSAGVIIIAGEVEKQNVNLTGSGSYEAGDLLTEDSDIQLTGVGSAVVWVEEDLDIDITGVGTVSYFGNPDVYQNISGLGSVNSKGSHK